jgi:DNA-binding MarR family transcriptional regulator
MDEELVQVALTCTFFHLKRAARLVTQLFDEAFAPVGLTAAQFNLLVMLALKKEPTLASLSRQLVMDRTTLTRNLALLEREGYVRLSVDRRDRRARTIALTAAGRRTLERGLPRWRQAQARLVERLGEARWTGLLDHLDAVSSADYEAAPPPAAPRPARSSRR